MLGLVQNNAPQITLLIYQTLLTLRILPSKFDHQPRAQNYLLSTLTPEA